MNSSSSSSSASLNLVPNNHLDNNNTSLEHLPPLPPSPRLVQHFLGFSLSTIFMDDQRDMPLEDGEILDSKISFPAFGAPFLLKKKCIKPQEELEVPSADDDAKTEPELNVTKYEESRQITSVSPSKDDVETNSDLNVPLETSSTLQNDSSPTDSVVTVIKDGAGCDHYKDESKADLGIFMVENSNILQDASSHGVDMADLGDHQEVGSSTGQSIDRAESLKTVPNSGNSSELMPIQKSESAVTDPTSNSSQKETELAPATVNEDGPTETSRSATTPKVSLPQSPTTSTNDKISVGHTMHIDGAQIILGSKSQLGMKLVPQSPALSNSIKPLENAKTWLKKDGPTSDSQAASVPSVPPHLRPAPVIPRSSSTQVLRHHVTPPGIPQGIRERYSQRQPQYTSNAMSNRDRDELPRVQAQNMQLRKELKVERERYQELQTNIHSETQEDIDIVLGPLMASQLHEKIALAKEKVLISQQKVDLNRRNTLIEQTEVFLAVGQRELYYQAQALEELTLSDAALQLARQQGATNATAEMRLRELSLQLGYQELNIQEVDLKSRKKVYKALAQSEIEAKLRAVLERDFEARARQIANEAHDRGFKEGREEGQKNSVEETNEVAFAEGYTTARQQQNTLVALKNGDLLYDSPDLDFLTNPDHPHNLFNMGMHVGRCETVAKGVRKAHPHRPTIFEQINGASTKINGQHILANRKSTPVDKIPDLIDGTPTPSNATRANGNIPSANLIPNLLDMDDVPYTRPANQVLKPLILSTSFSKRTKEQHVEVYTDGRFSHIDGKAVLTPENNPGFSSENAESARRMRSMPPTTSRRPDEVVAATADDFPSGQDMMDLY